MLAKRTFMTALLIAGATGLIAASPSSDKNNDKQITKAEFTANAEAKFAAADRNSDGQLNEQERARLNMRKYSKRKAAKRESQRARLLMEFDSNKDGRLSQEEEMIYVASFQADPNKVLSATEQRKMRKRARLDTNLDGMVSKSEYLKLTDILFSMNDKNGDGVIAHNESNPLGSWLRAG